LALVTATLLDGRAIAAQIRAEIAERVMALVDRGIQPGLAAVLVGSDEASRIYLGSKHKACADVGMRSEQIDLPTFVTEGELLATIRRLNRDPEIHGIIVQVPLPRHVSELEVQTTIDPMKDVDGLHPLNVGLMVRGAPSFPPATPYGIVELLLRSGIELEGAEVVVVGYGELVGAPLSIMLAQDSIRGNATVTICHIKTRDLASQTRRADILVAAAGKPQLITADMVKPGAVVVDVGVHRTDDGLVGDVKFDEVKEVAGAITPVPGGVGPMTTAMLLLNTVTAAEALVDRR
jgi:methylenetetrahydrofolate dehydrogenase (NADP+)/methenyltetrahydrofolate cyclohydrolase